MSINQLLSNDRNSLLLWYFLETMLEFMFDVVYNLHGLPCTLCFHSQHSCAYGFVRNMFTKLKHYIVISRSKFSLGISSNHGRIYFFEQMYHTYPCLYVGADQYSNSFKNSRYSWENMMFYQKLHAIVSIVKTAQ